MRVNLRDGNRTQDPTGYGSINRGLLKSLSELGHEVGSDLAPIDNPEVELFACPPYGFTNLKAGVHNVAITMTEREKLDGYKDRFDWVGLCNQMDLIITPSTWNYETFRREGITVPMVVLPMGLDTGFWKPRPYHFLSVIDGLGSKTSRWNWQDLYDAYKEAFAGVSEVEWTIKSREGKPGYWSNNLPKITAFEANYSEREMLDLFQRHDCYLDYSREGWCMPVWQAVSCGLTIIAPNHGVFREWLSASPYVRVFAPGKLSEDNLSFEGGNLVDLQQAMIDAWRKFLEREHIRRSRHVQSWQAAAGAMIDTIERVMNGLEARNRGR